MQASDELDGYKRGLSFLQETYVTLFPPEAAPEEPIPAEPVPVVEDEAQEPQGNA